MSLANRGAAALERARAFVRRVICTVAVRAGDYIGRKCSGQEGGRGEAGAARLRGAFSAATDGARSPATPARDQQSVREARPRTRPPAPCLRFALLLLRPWLVGPLRRMPLQCIHLLAVCDALCGPFFRLEERLRCFLFIERAEQVRPSATSGWPLPRQRAEEDWRGPQ